MKSSTAVSEPLAPTALAPQAKELRKPTSTPKGASTTVSKAAKPVESKPKTVAKKLPVTQKSVVIKPAKATAPIAVEDTKAKKPKLVRDSFTIPKDEYAAIEILKQRAFHMAQPVKKSELLRAGLKILVSLSDAALRNALQAVPSIKTGRPKADAAEVATAAKLQRSDKSDSTKAQTKPSRK